jgi:adenylate kinase
MNIALIGASGAGKGTHLPVLQKQFGMLHISTGDVFRSHVLKKTALGYLAQKYMDQGELIPDEIVEAMLHEELCKLSFDQGILFDGFPRTLTQATFVDGLLKDAGQMLDAVIYLKVSDGEIIKRLAGRLVCRECLHPFHKSLAPFITCPEHKCQGEHLFQREDDKAQLVRSRLWAFHRVTEPLLDLYQLTRRLIIIEGEGDSAAVGERLVQAVKSIRTQTASYATAQETTMLQSPNLFVPRLESIQTLKRSLDLVLLGPPGAGKGTQSDALSKHFHLRHIPTGSLFREHVRMQTDLGKIAKAFLDRGELVTDDITVEMISVRLAQPDTSNGFVLDGYPRTLAQARSLESILHDLHRMLAGVVYLRVSDEQILHRFTGRLLCQQCMTAYHVEFRPEAKPGLCDLCGSALYKPEDDNPEVVKTRLAAFHRQTEPLIEFYRQIGILVEVNGEGTIQEVTAEALGKVKKLTSVPHFRKFQVTET